jgi:hypothetical protein
VFLKDILNSQQTQVKILLVYIIFPDIFRFLLKGLIIIKGAFSNPANIAKEELKNGKS